MKNFEYRMRIAFLLSAVFIVCAAAGCCKPCETKASIGKKVVAKIHGYELTAADFQEEARLTAPNMYLSADPAKAREQVLNELITKKILLLDAQRRNFDKDKEFMKEIERYWEQALLKSLMKKKIDEFSKKIDPNIVGDARQKMIQSELNKWLLDARNSAKVKIYDDNLKDIRIK